MPKYEIGDIVRISKKSDYYGRHSNNPKYVNGEVVENDRKSSYAYYVKWNNGRQNSYREEDLKLYRRKDDN